MSSRPGSRRRYDVNDPRKIQGRDEVRLGDRSLAALRLKRAFTAIGGGKQSILLPGAGAGRYARAVAHYRPGWNVVAGDISYQAVDEAIRIGGGPSYSVFDAESIPFEDGTFDSIVFFDLLEHVPNPDLLLAECHRVLQPGGILHFFVPLEDQPGSLYRIFASDSPVPIHRWKTDHVGHIQRYRDADVLALAWASGFEVRDTAYSFHLTGQVHDVLDYWQRERSRGGDGLLPTRIVNLICRIAFVATWRGAFLEDSIYDGPLLASGLHVTAQRSA